MDAAAYSFELPPELVAQDPPAERAASRLLVAERGGGVLGVRAFAELPELLAPDDLLVFNDSRVLPARLWTRRVDSGGRVELLLLYPAGAPSRWRALARPARRLRPEQELVVHAPGDDLAEGARLRIEAVDAAGEVTVSETAGADLATVAEKLGDIPLPPYIRRDPAAPGADARRRRDRERYQTVYARPDYQGGASVAAPTAGLHFDQAALDGLAARGIATARVRLDVGPGTFRPPGAEQIARRRLHPEAFELPAATAIALADCRAAGGRVVAVGTTSLRVLETVAGLALPGDPPPGTVRDFPAAPDAEPVFTGSATREERGWSVRGVTRLFVAPPDEVTACQALLTNFHLPGSSLIMLVAAFAGEAAWREAYREAVARRLRFYSYGDAMLILPAGDEERS